MGMFAVIFGKAYYEGILTKGSEKFLTTKEACAALKIKGLLFYWITTLNYSISVFHRQGKFVLTPADA